MSHSLGFLKAGGDVDGILQALQKDLDYKGIVGPPKSSSEKLKQWIVHYSTILHG